MDMVALYMTKSNVKINILKVISINNIFMNYFMVENKDTSPLSIICRITGDLYKPRVKMR